MDPPNVTMSSDNTYSYRITSKSRSYIGIGDRQTVSNLRVNKNLIEILIATDWSKTSLSLGNTLKAYPDHK